MDFRILGVVVHFLALCGKVPCVYPDVGVIIFVFLGMKIIGGQHCGDSDMKRIHKVNCAFVRDPWNRFSLFGHYSYIWHNFFARSWGWSSRFGSRCWF